MDNNIGKKLDGRYELLELIGVGGMADIYRARDIQEDRIVAVKILKTEFAGSDEFLRRFRNESKAIALLSHPNIVKIYDVGFTDKVQFIVMEYVDGITLTDYIEQQGVLKWRDAVHFTIQVLRALQHAHDRGIVHRDVKSSNIMLLRDGTIKVMDFGIARFNRENNKTMSEKTIGSVHYISPEQARGDITDERSDIYSVGVALYEMLTGRKPFDGDTPVAIALKHMQSAPRRPSELNETIPEGLEQIVLRAMQKEPSARYQTAGEMISDLEEFKKNPGIVFDYKYNSTDGTAKFVDRPNPAVDKKAARHRMPEEDDEVYDDDDYYDDDDDDEYEERRSPLIPILFAVGAAFVIATVFLLLKLVVDGFGPNSTSISGVQSDIIQVGPNGEFSMPNLVGMSWDEASNMYGNYLNLVPRQENNDAPKDQIFEQDPPNGRTVKLNQTVTVKVSKGRRMSEIFDFKNRPYSYAIQQLEREGFKYQIIRRQSEDVANDCVIETNPAAHTMAEQGSMVVVIVSSGSKNSSIEVPKFTEMTIDAAQKLCEELNLVPKMEEVNSEKPKGEVVEQSVEPGTMVDKNTTITLKVSSGEVPLISTEINIVIPTGYSGEFEFRYFVGGSLVPLAQPDIRDVSLSSNRTIKYTLEGRVDETAKTFDVKVISRATKKEGFFLQLSVDFSQDPPKQTEVDKNSKIFYELQQTDTSDDNSSGSGSESSNSSSSDNSGSSDTSAPEVSSVDRQALMAAIANRNFDDYGDLLNYKGNVSDVKKILSKYGYNASSGTRLSNSDIKLIEALLKSGGN